MKLRENLNSRFSDLFSLEVHPWMMDRFCCDIESVDENLQRNLLNQNVMMNVITNLKEVK